MAAERRIIVESCNPAIGFYNPAIGYLEAIFSCASRF